MIKLITVSLIFLFILISGNISAENVRIDYWENPNEPAIMINPELPHVLVVGANMNKYYTSLDTGRNWQKHTLQSNFGVWGDPVIDVDTLGNFYYLHLSRLPGKVTNMIVCQKSTNHGSNWFDWADIGYNESKFQDKHWSVIDRKNHNFYITWTQFDEYASKDKDCKSIIRFTSLYTQSWSKPVKINSVDGDCRDSSNTVEGATPAVGAGGEVYVSWAGPNGLVFNRSTDEGDTWLENEIKIVDIPGGWSFDIPGIYRCNGFPVTKCDLSGGENHGTIYINWSDQRNGVNDTDIWLVKSTDRGDTWTSPIRVLRRRLA